MKEQFSKEEDRLSDGKPICQILVYTEEDGNIYFSCDWDSSEDAVTSLGAMLYRLSEGELIDEIIDNLKSQCVLEEREEDYDKIYNLFNNLKSLKESVDDLSEDKVVMNPTDATNF
tara:strand:- start:2013 stop:2360 length:348 start_codon:yes stop_codon:yes gene_type:complete